MATEQDLQRQIDETQGQLINRTSPNAFAQKLRETLMGNPAFSALDQSKVASQTQLGSARQSLTANLTPDELANINPAQQRALVQQQRSGLEASIGATDSARQRLGGSVEAGVQSAGSYEEDIQQNLTKRLGALTSDLQNVQSKKAETKQLAFGLANTGVALTPEINSMLDANLTKDEKSIWLSANATANKQKAIVAGATKNRNTTTVTRTDPATGAQYQVVVDANTGEEVYNGQTGLANGQQPPPQPTLNDQLKQLGVVRVASGGGFGFTDTNNKPLSVQDVAQITKAPVGLLLSGSTSPQDQPVVQKYQKELLQSQGPYASAVQSTVSGNKYINLQNYTTNKDEVATWAANAGVATISDPKDIQDLQAIDTARLNSQSILNAASGVLPADVMQRIFSSPNRKIADFTQSKNDQKAWNLYETTAIQAVKTLSNVNVRFTKDSVKEASKYIPSRNDTMNEAASKIKKLQSLLDNAEAPLVNRDRSNLTGASSGSTGSSGLSDQDAYQQYLKIVNGGQQ